MVTGLIHLVIEGWVVAKADFYKDASGNYLSDTCEMLVPLGVAATGVAATGVAPCTITSERWLEVG